ncbi:MAG: hypothetical protein K6E10_02655 [Eubacterium sp.]|nr:hypothetical protein [Eubacterium sp.]
MDKKINSGKTKSNNNPNIIIGRAIIFLLGAGLLIVGLVDGGFRDVMAKAIRICYECIGIG